MPIEQVEFNTIITFLGMLCATVQGITERATPGAEQCFF